MVIFGTVNLRQCMSLLTADVSGVPDHKNFEMFPRLLLDFYLIYVIIHKGIFSKA